MQICESVSVEHLLTHFMSQMPGLCYDLEYTAPIGSGTSHMSSKLSLTLKNCRKPGYIR